MDRNFVPRPHIDVVLSENLKRFLVVGKKAILWATADAMTSAGADAQRHLQRVTPQYIDRPTPFTVRSVRRWPGYVKPPRLSQWIGFGAIGAREHHYLEPMAYGGTRPLKRSEERLRSINAPGRYLMPTGNSPLRLNKYGNLTGGRYVQVLSQLKAFNTDGFNANATGSRRSKLKRAKQAFFIRRARTGRAAAVVYARLSKRTIRPVLTLTNKEPRYRRQFPVEDILVARYTQRFNAAIKLYMNRKLDKLSR